MFKKITKVLCAIAVLGMVNSVNALTVNKDGSITSKNQVTLSKQQYDTIKKEGYDDSVIDSVSETLLMKLANPNKKYFGHSEKHIITTTEKDKLGRIITSRSIEVTPIVGELVLNNSNMHILSDNKLHDISKGKKLLKADNNNSEYDTIETTYKVLGIGYWYDGHYCTVLSNLWRKAPKVKHYDIIATRFENSIGVNNISNWEGEQVTQGSAPNVEYDKTSSNFKVFSNGVGLTQNLYDDYVPASNYLWTWSERYLGQYVYGSYQHATTTNLTMAQSKSYTLNKNGLGGVIKHSYANKYDGMIGVYIDKNTED